MKSSVLGGRVAFEGTWFRMRRDGIVHTVRQGPFFIPTNAGAHGYKGVELGARWTPTPRVSAYVNAALYRNRFGEFVIEQAGGDTDLTGNRLPISPDRIVNGG